MLQLKLEAGDVGAAERLAKRTGISIDEALKFYSDLNIRNTPSYQGGELIQKKGINARKSKAEKAASKLGKQARDAMRKAYGAHPPEAIRQAIAGYIVLVIHPAKPNVLPDDTRFSGMQTVLPSEA